MIDLRSDTVTRPTPGMRQAMASAAVGDDVFGDDPTVTTLERRVAEILGKEAAVYMPSGTMTNQVAIRAHTEPGDEIIVEAEAHVYYFEGGAPAALSGVMCRLIAGRRGIFTVDDVRAVLRQRNVHFPPTRLICIENTHNRGGGSIWPIANIAAIADLARQSGLRMHLDGARLWNASAATGVPEWEYAGHFDSVSVCFSKSLGAPVGSALAGTREFIERARRFRKQFGGGMRQSGIIAAGALYALEHHRQRLTEDHANAKRLAEGLAACPGIEIDPSAVDTNILFVKVPAMPAAELSARLKAAGILVNARDDRLRLVTHLDVSRPQIEETIEVFRRVLDAGRG